MGFKGLTIALIIIINNDDHNVVEIHREKFLKEKKNHKKKDIKMIRKINILKCLLTTISIL